ncbi:MAG TPA: outer membrane beta-barrel protein [Mucilaginibacter sp.]|nr:outer membrane beta-barrel protein [Mucilaginibacter sp.]
MRNWNQYLKLWQQKRNELHISSDMKADWSDMHHLLDEQMPLDGKPGVGNNAGHSGGGNPGTGTGLLNLAKFKLLYVAAGLIIGSAITYVVIRNANQKADKVYKQNKTEIRKDSLSARSVLKTAGDLQKANNESAIGGQKDDQSNQSSGARINSSVDKNNIANGDRSTNGSTVVKDNARDIAVGTNAAISNDKKSNSAPAVKNNATNNARPSSSITNGNTGSNAVNDSHLSSRASNRASGNSSVNRNHSVSSSMTKNSKASGNSTYRRSSHPERHTRSFNLSNRRNALPSNNSYRTNSDNNPNITAGDSRNIYDASVIDAITPPSTLTWAYIVANNNQAVANNLENTITDRFAGRITSSGKDLSVNKADKNVKDAKTSKPARKPAHGNLDWGLLAGTDGMGSLTPQSQNHNIYGSLPIDIYVGLFGTYNLNDHWAIGLQSRLLVPHTVNGHYSYNHVKTDTPKTTETIQISDSRKVYTLDFPVHLIYKVNPNISLKAGPILSIPVKTANGTYPTAGNDSTGNGNSVTRSLNATAPAKKILFGASAGIGFSYKFLWFDAMYNYSPQPLNMRSDLGSYTSNTNSLQLTIGIKLNKSKK